MKIVVKFFASAADAAGQRERHLELPEGSDVKALLDQLCMECPKLGRIRASLRVAVNKQYAKETDRVCQGAEVALIPPVSGGQQ